MQVSLETTSGLERRLTVGVPAEQVENEVENRLKQAARNVTIKGFRKGKVPLSVVKQRFGAGIRQEVVGDVINRSFYAAVQKENLKPAGQPSIQPKQLSAGQDLEYIAVFEVYPSVELSDLSVFEITRHKAEVTDVDVDNMIDVLRKHQATWTQVERAAADGDQVNINFVGTKDGVEFAGGKADNQNLILGSNSMIPGFEAGLVGLKSGDQKTLALTFPEDYHSEELKGAAVEFAVTVNSVSEAVLPELNKEFFQKFGVEKGGEKQFRKEVKANMERELGNALKAKVKGQVMDALVASHTVDVPKALVANEIQVLRNQMLQRFGGQQQNFDVKSLLPDTMFQEEASRRVTLGLIVGEIVKSAKLKPDAKRIKSMIEEIASTYQEPQEVIDYYNSNQELLAGVESAVLEDQVVDHILSKAKVSDVDSTYDDVIKSKAQR
ncbi:trigger factor [Cellvibrio japonicus]|uniref:Trigger factor n=1 Tax=Cellvibrio japonicus (strain Ueda107) TaxID=498211 RepID=TIG_CELJU|nr:trigger factor [Cellvibrio japonicus]B3PHK7.1 RecName: Full=Trigger factor; Short=TF; AltName: Full=PPIase [Cellvibrio japonicus Ueda107]ACE83430.1 trigger factor [Cellvibrio japonicus Ueda107]QEI12482.1 trigger factor [Cellvibrio japonicus]QEI16056.1 trigger factor [Cellvibrio japonicus]QEI19634.1 trigger factor [Cellvibrio japonicus]